MSNQAYKTHSAYSVFVVTENKATAANLQETIILRGFDKVRHMTLHEALASDRHWHEMDLVLLDPEGQTSLGLQVLKKLGKDVPVIFLAESFEEDTFVGCYDAGARDFLVKPVNPTYLVSRVLLILDEGHRKQQLAQKNRVLSELGIVSSFTGFFTTEYIVKMLKWELEKYTDTMDFDLSMVVVYLMGFEPSMSVNLDFKKKLYGEVSSILTDACRGADIVGEYFEDKFALVLPDTPIKGAERVSERILKQLQGYSFEFQGKTYRIQAHVGIADYEGCVHYEDLINKAMEGVKQSMLLPTTQVSA